MGNHHCFCPFHCIDVDHQHVSEHGHRRFRTESYRQVDMEEPDLLLLVNNRQIDIYISLFDANTMFTNLLEILLPKNKTYKLYI